MRENEALPLGDSGKCSPGTVSRPRRFRSRKARLGQRFSQLGELTPRPGAPSEPSLPRRGASGDWGFPPE